MSVKAKNKVQDVQVIKKEVLKMPLKLNGIKIIETNRFSRYVKSKSSDDYKHLETWQNWFIGRGISSVIATTSSGYALYRNGLIEIDIHADRDLD